jgi:hypothetical protein
VQAPESSWSTLNFHLNKVYKLLSRSISHRSSLNGTQRNVPERGDETKWPWPFWPCFDLEPPSKQLAELPMSRVPWPPLPNQFQFVFGTAHKGRNYRFASRLQNHSKYLEQQLDWTRHNNHRSSVAYERGRSEEGTAPPSSRSSRLVPPDADDAPVFLPAVGAYPRRRRLAEDGEGEGEGR